MRANNLKGGRAFEFVTVGKEAGLIQVGDTTAPPFTTNATGKVANLDADKVDGKSSEDFASAGDLGFASVKADGTFVAGRGATASTKSNVAENTYTVTFNKDVSKCSFTARRARARSSDVGGFGADGRPAADAGRRRRARQRRRRRRPRLPPAGDLLS